MRITGMIICICCCLSAVQAEWLEKNIKLPDSLGAFAGNGCQVWDSADNKLFLAGDNGVLIVDAATKERLAIAPTSGSVGAFCCCPSAHKVYCATSSGSVVVINGATNQVLTTVPVSARPGALCYNSLNNKVYSADGDSDEVCVIDCGTDGVVATIRDVGSPSLLVYGSGSNKMYCAGDRSDTVAVIDGAADTVAAHVLVNDGVGALTYDAHDDKVYATCRGSIAVIGGASNSIMTWIPIPNYPMALCYDSRDDRVYRASYGPGVVTSIDCKADTVQKTIVAGPPYGSEDFCYNSRDNRVYCFRQSSDPPAVQVIDCTGDTLAGVLTTYGDNICYNSTDDVVYCTDERGIVTIVDGATQKIAGAVASRDLPYAFCYVPQHNRVYCACYYSHAAAAIDAGTNALLTRIPTGLGTRNFCYSSKQDKLYCVSEMSGDLTVISPTMDTVLTTLSGACWDDALCYNPRDSKVYCEGDNAWVVVVDASADTVLRKINAAYPWAAELEYNAENDKVYAQCGYPTEGVVVIDAAADTVRKWLDLEMGGTLCFSPVQNRAYLSRSDSVFVVDGASDSIITAISVGLSPGFLCYDSKDDRVCCTVSTNYYGDSMVVINCATNVVVATFPIPAGTQAVCYGQEYNRVYCTCQTDTVTVIDAGSNAVVAKVDVGGNPGPMVWDPAQSRLYVANKGSYISVLRDSGEGIQEGRKLAAGTKPLPTIVRGILFLPRSLDPSISRSLLDISGRKVMDLLPGPNDVRALAPGVYFVREQPQAASHKPQAIRKVVVTR